MTDNEAIPRPFRVRARHEDPHHGRILVEGSFEAAAIAYVEHLPLPADATSEIRVVVHEVGTGQEHGFRLRLDHGDVTPLG